MAHINLLPWRQELRKQRQKQFFSLLALAALVALGVVGAGHMYLDELISYQNTRNQYLETQIKQLDSKIKEIQDLERERERLLARMRAIEQLQTSRPIIVRLFDEIVDTVPDGVYLREIVQQGNAITIKGVARSNARVSNLMRNIEASDWVANPQLDVIQTVQRDGTRQADFTLKFQQVDRKAAAEAEAAGG